MSSILHIFRKMMARCFRPFIRKRPWKTRYTTQSYATIWKWRSTTASFVTWRRSWPNCAQTSRVRLKSTRRCSTWRWNWSPRSPPTKSSWTVETSSKGYSQAEEVNEQAGWRSQLWLRRLPELWLCLARTLKLRSQGVRMTHKWCGG